MKELNIRLLWIPALALTLLGLIMVYSSSATVANAQFHDSFFYFKRQLFYVVAGLFTLVVAIQINTDIYRHFAYPLFFIATALLLVVLIPGIGKSAGGAARWISLGFVRVQPGEFFKVALIIYLAMSLAKKGKNMQLFHVGIIPHIVLPGIGMVLLMLEPDFGTTFMVASLTFVMLLLGGARVAYLALGLLIAIPTGIHLIASSPYRLERIMAFLDPWAHRQNEGYQVVESLMTFGSGELWGLGLGQGPGKLYFLPAAHTDFILSVIGEELGFIGITLVLACFACLAVAGFLTAKAQNEAFKSFLATGITTMLVLQAIFNSFVVMGLVPTKGITLPFVSFGGSSLVMSCFMIGLLIRLTKESP